jgi:hypothetical protein
MNAVMRTDCTGKYREYTGDIHTDCVQFSDHHPRFVMILNRRIIELDQYTTSAERTTIREAFLGHHVIVMMRYFDRWMNVKYDTVEEFWQSMVAEYRLAPNNEDLAEVMKI